MKRLIRVALLLAILVAVGAAWWWMRSNPAPVAAGVPLLPARVGPQLINTWDTAVLLAPDGSLWGWGGAQFQLAGLFERPTTTQIPKRIGSESDWRAIAANHMSVLAQKADGSLWGWGGNGSGQLAQPARTNHVTPVRIGTATNWTQISAGMGHVLGLKEDGSLWAWGQNDRGQVGDGTQSNAFVVTQIGADFNWTAVSAGAFNSFALKKDGTLWGWGLDPITGGTGDTLVPGQIDPGTNWSSISAGDYCLLALRSDGTLWIRGQNAHLAAGDTLTGSTGTLTRIGGDNDWAEVHAGQGFFFARKQNGSWWVCGQNSERQLGVGVGMMIGSPRRFPTAFEPWAMSPGFGNTVWLNRDGALWTLGTRLGSGTPSQSLPDALKGIINRIFAPVLNRPLFRSKVATVDLVPHKIWELPAEMRQTSTGTN